MIDQVLKNLKIQALNDMQLAALEAAVKERDVILLSPTGTGKTLGFLLPLLRLLKKDMSGIQALILTPSRELALQIEEVFRSMKTGIKVSCFYGGHSIKTEKNSLKHPPAVIIGTPGRIADHIDRGNLDTSTIETLVLDEFDKSLEFGFQKEMSFIVRRIKNLKRRFLTSATNMDQIPDFTGVQSPVVLDHLEESAIPGFELKAVRSEGKDKLQALFGLICNLGNQSTLVFCNHRDSISRVSELLKEKKVDHDVFHGGMEQEDREKALIKFRNGTHHLLITTDLAARGLDIPEIENIIHYQLSKTENAFIHRNGRTARMKSGGTAYLVLSEEENLPDYITTLPEFCELPQNCVFPGKSPWSTLYLSAGRKDRLNKMDIVGFLLQKGKLQKEDLGLIEVKDHSSFAAVKRDKIEQLVQMVKGEKIKKKSVKMEIAR